MSTRYDSRDFGGDYEPESEPTMRTNMDKVRNFMTSHPGVWFTKEQIRKGAGLPDGTDVTPRLRDLRKPQFGAWAITMSYIEQEYRYKLEPHRSTVILEKEGPI